MTACVEVLQFDIDYPRLVRGCPDLNDRARSDTPDPQDLGRSTTKKNEWSRTTLAFEPNEVSAT